MNMDESTRLALAERMAKVNAKPGHVRAQHPMSWRKNQGWRAQPSQAQVHPAYRGRPQRRGFRGADDAAPSLPTTLPPPGPMPASQALALLQARYAQLSRLGAGLAQLGIVVPCNVIDVYSKAVSSYVHDGIDLFKQIEQGGGVVEQIVFQNGEPQRDARGDFVSQTVSTPLLPPFPITDPKKCPGFLPFARQLAGLAGAPAQFGQAVPVSAIVGALRVAWPYIVRIGAVLATTWAVNTVLDKITVIWRGYNTAPDKAVDAYLSCVSKTMASGVTAAAAAQRCADVVPGSGMSTLAWIGVFSLVAVGAGGAAYYFFKKTSPAERERKERIVAADREAEEAHEAAQRASSRARRYRAGHFSPAEA